MSDKYMNEKEFRYFTSGRAGYHAIIYWLLRYYPGTCMFLNMSVRLALQRLRYRRPGRFTFDGRYKGYTVKEAAQEVISIYNRTLDGAKKKDLFIHSIESPLEWPEEVNITNQRDEVSTWYRGESKELHDIVHIRDLFNLISSRHEKAKKTNQGMNYTLVTRIWKGLAREYLRDTSYLDDPIRILYNEWFSSEEYRRQLGEKLGLQGNFHEQYQEIQNGPGTGSSFSRRSQNGQAGKMKVLERYKTKIGHPILNMAINDEEIVELSRRIFKDTCFDVDKVVDEIKKGSE